MVYELLEEQGATRRVELVRRGDFAVEIRVTMPQYLPDDYTKPFFFYVWRRSHKKDGGWNSPNMWPTGFTDINELKKLASQTFDESIHAPQKVINELLSKVDVVELKTPDYYFELVEDAERKRRRKLLEEFYRQSPGNNYREKKQIIIGNNSFAT